MPLLGLAPEGPQDLLSPAGLGAKWPPEYVSAFLRDPDRTPFELLEEGCDLCGLKEV